MATVSEAPLVGGGVGDGTTISSTSMISVISVVKESSESSSSLSLSLVDLLLLDDPEDDDPEDEHTDGADFKLLLSDPLLFDDFATGIPGTGE